MSELIARVVIMFVYLIVGGCLIGKAIEEYKDGKYVVCGANIMLSIGEITMMICSMIKWHF